MPEGSGIGLYPYGEVGYARENDEVSSTYEGRHLTVTEAQVTGHEHTWVTKGHPVVVGENIVGVVLSIERTDGTIGIAANAATDYITIDTEGIFLQSVVALNPAAVVVAAGDELFINKTTGIISNESNKNTHARFGYALGGVTAGNTAIISVKVHWDPDDAEEKVGTHTVPLVSAEDSKIFREYRYRSSSAVGDIRGQYMELMLAGIGASGEAGRNRTMVEAAVAVAHGCHDGIEFATGGSITGLGVGHRATYKAADKAAGGTIAGGMSELYADGDSTDYGTATEHSIHRFVNDGEATGLATADNVFAFTGLTAVQYAANTDTPAFALRCLINGNIRYIMVSEAQA